MHPMSKCSSHQKHSITDRKLFTHDGFLSYQKYALIVYTFRTMDKYISWWYSKVNDGQPKLFITDSSSTHLNEETIRLMRRQRVVVAVIPKGCTMYIHALDVHVFSTFKHHHYECVEEWIEKNGGRSK